MKPTSVTVGVPVTDLAAARTWYERTFELPAPDLEPVPGVAEYQVCGAWLQLMEVEQGGGPWVFRLEVPDVAAEHERLTTLGLSLGEIVVVEGLIDFFEFADPDGNQLSLYTDKTKP
ncbi:VOC family protein [Nocardia crassostreae]|uniref:VOC family protein n=1 Tax=Nocardia crassostreae TaxID=53428 RepID=UPI00082FC61D|nr:VOC family protein [Nocardia crassostreae]